MANELMDFMLSEMIESEYDIRLYEEEIIEEGAKPPLWIKRKHLPMGYFRVSMTPQYELYVGEDGNEPDFTASPIATNPSLPVSYYLSPPVSGTKEYKLTCRYRNKYGISSLNQYSRSFIIDNTGALITPDPSSPRNTSVSNYNNLSVNIYAEYTYKNDGDNKGDYWDLYYTTNGIDPNPLIDVPVSYSVLETGTIAKFNKIISGLSFGQVFKMILRIRRSSDSVDDGNTTIYTVTIPNQLSTPESAGEFGGSYYDYRNI